MFKKTPCLTDVGCPIPDLLPENEITWTLFTTISMSPRVDALGSFMGYDYSLLPTLFKAHEIPPRNWKVIIDGLNIITSIAIRINKELREKNAN